MIERWYVVFGATARETPWWLRWMKPAHRHCWAFGYDHDGPGWIEVNPGFNGVAMGVLREGTADRLIRLGEAGRVPMLRIAPLLAGPHRPRLFGMLTCAGMLAHVIGLRETVWSPRALHRHLIRAGAVPVAEDGSHGQGVSWAEDRGRAGAGRDAAGQRRSLAGAG